MRRHLRASATTQFLVVIPSAARNPRISLLATERSDVPAKAPPPDISPSMPLFLERAPHAQAARTSILSSQPARVLHLWHLLSLDAPTVATLWTAFVARSSGIQLPAISLVAMFLMVWTLYAADRLLDAQPLHQHPTASPDLELRHLFHHRHRRPFLITIGVATLSLSALIPQLPAAALHLFLVLGTLVAGYFILIHATSGAARLPKELAVGLFFSAAIFIPTVARLAPTRLGQPASTSLLPYTAADPRLPFALPALLFAALCCLNCLCIYAWEHPHVTARAPLPHRVTQAASQHRRSLSFALLLASLADALAARSEIAAAIALAILALLTLDSLRHRLSPLTLRAAADLALTTPVLFLPWLSLVRGVPR